MFTDDLFGGRPPVPGFPPRNPVDELAVSVRKNAADIASHAADAGAHVTTGEKAAWNAKADLAGGKVPQEQLPSYVDDVLEYAALSSFPQTGETGKIYVDTSTGRTYRWSGSGYVQIGGEEQVQADWDQTDASAADFIKNKPPIPAAVTVDSALSGSSTNPVQNKVVTAALNGKATTAQGAKADAALSRAEAVAGFTEWVCNPAMIGDERVYIEWDGNYWIPTNGGGKSGLVNGNATSTNLAWEANDWWGGVPLTATRTRLPTMADIPTDNAQLTNGAGYATTTAMNAALAGKADASALPYALVTVTPTAGAPFVLAACFPMAFSVNGTSYEVSLSNRSDITVDEGVLVYINEHPLCRLNDDGTFSSLWVAEGLTFNNVQPTADTTQVLGFTQTATLLDRAHNVFAVDAPGSGNTTTITATLPPIIAGKSRDMFLNLTVGSAASDAGDVSLSIVEPGGAIVQIDIGSVEDIGVGRNEIMISENAPPTTSGNVTTTHWIVTVRHEDFAS